MIDFRTDPFAWLEQEPLESDLAYNVDGSIYQPIEVIKAKLDIYSPTWETKNFNHNFFIAPFGTFYCSGSVELILNPAFTRTIVGAATFDVEKYYKSGFADSNQNFAPTILSLCIVNAAQNISPFFGKNLNKKQVDKSDEMHSKIQNTFNNIIGK